jgi:hypothetical protein
MSTIEHEGHNPDETRNYFTGDHWSIPSDIELAPEAAEAFKQQLLESGWTMEEIDDNFLVEGFQEALNKMPFVFDDGVDADLQFLSHH